MLFEYGRHNRRIDEQAIETVVKIVFTNFRVVVDIKPTICTQENITAVVLNYVENFTQRSRGSRICHSVTFSKILSLTEETLCSATKLISG